MLFLGPIALLYSGIVPMRFRFWIGGLGCLLVCAIVASERWPLRDLGIRLDNLRSGLVPYALFTTVGVLLVMLVGHATGRLPRARLFEDPFFRYYLVPISVLQEVVFRGFLMPKLQALCKSAAAAVFWNAVFFAGIHLIYPDLGVALPLIFAGGIGFAAIYSAHPNLLLVSASHVVLGFVALRYCFFSLVARCV